MRGSNTNAGALSIEMGTAAKTGIFRRSFIYAEIRADDVTCVVVEKELAEMPTATGPLTG